MKKFDYFYASYVGKVQNTSEWLLKSIVKTKSKGLAKQVNVQYGEDKSQRLDLFYKPSAKDDKLPIFFYIHGGGFVSGKTTLRRPYCADMAHQGFFVVNVDYRLAPKVQFPHTFNDIFRTIDYVLNKSEEYNLDCSKIVIGGESAGAYFASYIAAMTKDKSLYEHFNIDFQRKYEFEIASCVLINGAYDIESIVKATAPFKKTFVKAFFDLTNKDLKDEEKISNKYFSTLNFIDSTFPKSIVIRGKHDVFDLGTEKLLQTFDKNDVEYSLFLANGVAGLHAVTIVPLFKQSVQSQNFTVNKLKEYLGIDDLKEN